MLPEHLTGYSQNLSMETYNVLVAELSELCELLGHEELGHPYDHEDGVPDLVTDEAALAVQILLEITDILLELEYFILKHLQLIWNVYKYFSCCTTL